MGTMELTPEGLWIDPGTISPELLLSLPGTTVGGMIECECNECGLPYNPLPVEADYNPPMIGVGYDGESVLDEEPMIDGDQLVPMPPEPMPIESLPSERLDEDVQERIDPLLPPGGELSPPAPPEANLVPTPIESL
jgi:hypothetical protein